jgi:hypothetical protein
MVGCTLASLCPPVSVDVTAILEPEAVLLLTWNGLPIENVPTATPKPAVRPLSTTVPVMKLLLFGALTLMVLVPDDAMAGISAAVSV